MWDRTKIGVGNSFTVKFKEINEKIGEEKVEKCRNIWLDCIIYHTSIPSMYFLSFGG